MTLIALLLAAVALLALLGLPLAVAALCALAAGGLWRVFMPTVDSGPATAQAAESARLIRRTRSAAGLPPIQ